jgi:hypothetical protein
MEKQTATIGKLQQRHSIRSPELNQIIIPIKIAGRLQHYKHQWLLNFGKSWITNIVSHGYFPEWQNTPLLEVIPVSHRDYRHTDLPIFNQEVKKLLDSGAIRKLDPQIPCFISNIFMVPKKTGDLRPVIDLYKLN